jgi:hypothetical protein
LEVCSAEITAKALAQAIRLLYRSVQVADATTNIVSAKEEVNGNMRSVENDRVNNPRPTDAQRNTSFKEQEEGPAGNATSEVLSTSNDAKPAGEIGDGALEMSKLTLTRD